MEPTWTVGEVSRLARVTVRTLHHYDAIGLLVPSARSEAGYRLYGAAELERLHQIRLYREVGLPLSEIARALDHPDFDRIASLRAHRDRLAERVAEARQLIETIDRLLEEEDMAPEERFAGFDEDDYAEEAERRWGDTRAWKQSRRRTRTLSPEAKRRLMEEVAQLNRDFAACMAAGNAPDSAAAIALAEAFRLHICRNFYDCSREMHAQVARLYTEDPRFEATYEAVATGLAAYVRAATEANAARE